MCFNFLFIRVLSAFINEFFQKILVTAFHTFFDSDFVSFPKTYFRKVKKKHTLNE